MQNHNLKSEIDWVCMDSKTFDVYEFQPHFAFCIILEYHEANTLLNLKQK